MTNNAIIIAITGPAGVALATLPVSGYLCGKEQTTMGASVTM